MALKNKVIFFSGDYPHLISGVGDYVYNLKRELQFLGIDVSIITTNNSKITQESQVYPIMQWKTKDVIDALKLLKKITKNSQQLIHFQYPTSGCGKYNLLPHLLAAICRVLGYTVVTTLHEYSNVHLLRRISEWLFIIASHKIIVTAHSEKRKILKNDSFLRKWLERKTTVIPISSNIQICNKEYNYNSNIITFFGQFYPNKGYDVVLQWFEVIEHNFPGEYKFRFVGGTHYYYPNELPKFKQKAETRLGKENLEWIINKSISEVCSYIKGSFLIALPYKDGITIRKTTFLAALVNGIPILTNSGRYSYEDVDRQIFDKGVFLIKEKQDIVEAILSLRDRTKYVSCCNYLRKYGKRFSFKNVADKHIKLYEHINFRKYR